MTERVKAFYEETPFPDYDEFETLGSLEEKARSGRFARLLDEQIPRGASVLECGCGTGQLSNFLSIAAGRTVLATDISLSPLRLGKAFARDRGLRRVDFLQMNLFRPAFKASSFHLVVANGVLHHTSDPLLALKTIAPLVKPGGYLVVGLYHRYGRLVTDARRILFRILGSRVEFLDPILRRSGVSAKKKRAWYADQYQHPHESKHSFGEVLEWLDESGLQFVRFLPSTKLLRPAAETQTLFERDEPGSRVERFVSDIAMCFRSRREGGFFVVIAQRSGLAS